MTSLKDIAKKLNLSVSVVSRALNAAPDANARVSENTKKLILETAKRMHYRPNRYAEFMKRNRSAAIGVFIPDIANSLIAELLLGISEEANKHGFPVNIHNGLSKASYLDFMQNSINCASSGIITYSAEQYHQHETENILNEYCENGGKVLLLNNMNETKYVHLSMDEISGGRIAAEMLIKCRCDDYIVLHAVDNISRLRSDGFTNVLNDNGCHVSKFYLDDFNTLINLMKKNPDKKYGIFAVSDRGAINFIKQAASENIVCGRNYKITGYDNMDWTEFVSPSLSSVMQPFREQGKRAVQKLIAMIYGQKEKNELLTPAGIERESTSE